MRRARMRAAALMLALAPVAAAAYPDRPVTVINPYATGSQADATARALSDGLAAQLGQPVVVTNREGGSGVVGLRVLAASPPDGHTLAFSALVPLTIQPHLVRNTGLGPDAVAPICNVTENILGVIVRADSPWRSLPDMAAAARHRPVTYGSPGPNSAPSIGMERIRSATGGDYVHAPFRGDAASLLEVKAGRLDAAAIVVASGVPMARSGEMRLIGTFSLRRHPEFPGVPTAREQGIEAVELSAAGLFAPRGTPEPVLDRLEAACQAAMATEGFRTLTQRWAVLPEYLGRADFARRLADHFTDHAEVLRALGVQPE
ncbi:tripartite tricarboxylate transporter substrate binding protein [Dankookia rubra]|uniref:Tripartite tricarboxylate transporter substrate binding protein n=1 Tax=Dankookia rubra TaxID=1442381 RepID=A0A4R5QDF7_9PROT|nr:tripartite tricarboxylate transporter substrate binding protein [Dankookia rubra]TDH60397.1 tripartite tricarboxylate transporter substrate binding protein [Dankookia rubra]